MSDLVQRITRTHITSSRLGLTACFWQRSIRSTSSPHSWTLPREPEEITTSEAVELSWASSFHNVYQVPTKDALDACDTTDFEVIAANGGEGSATLPAPADGEMAYYLCEAHQPRGTSRCAASRRGTLETSQLPHRYPTTASAA